MYKNKFEFAVIDDDYDITQCYVVLGGLEKNLYNEIVNNFRLNQASKALTALHFIDGDKENNRVFSNNENSLIANMSISQLFQKEFLLTVLQIESKDLNNTEIKESKFDNYNDIVDAVLLINESEKKELKEFNGILQSLLKDSTFILNISVNEDTKNYIETLFKNIININILIIKMYSKEIKSLMQHKLDNYINRNNSSITVEEFEESTS